MPEQGWGVLEFSEITSAAGRDWTDGGQVHEPRKPKGGPRNAIRRVPIPPVLVLMILEHLEEYGTADDGRLFRTYGGGIYQPSTLWRLLQRARAEVLTRRKSARHWLVGRTTSAMPASPGGSTLACLRPWSPSGPGTRSRSCSASTPIALTVTTTGGSGLWVMPLAGLELRGWLILVPRMFREHR